MWYPRSASGRSGRTGKDLWRLVSNRTHNNSDPHAASLCLTAPKAEGRVVRLEACADGDDSQAWRWSIDPMSGGNAHPDHP